MRENRVSQVMLDSILTICFLIILPTLKAVYAIIPASEKMKNSEPHESPTNLDVLSENSIIGTRWGLALYMWRQHKYHLIPLDLIVGFLCVFFRKERVIGKVSESIYDMVLGNSH